MSRWDRVAQSLLQPEYTFKRTAAGGFPIGIASIVKIFADGARHFSVIATDGYKDRVVGFYKTRADAEAAGDVALGKNFLEL